MTSGSVVPPRPKSHARLVDVDDDSIPRLPISLAGLDSVDDTVRWLPIGTCLAHFDCTTWLEIMRQHISHPERDSSNILRADILEEQEATSLFSPYTHRTVIKRKLLARRPNLDDALLQTCNLYQDDDGNAVVIYIPHTETGFPKSPDQIPFYHPKVRGIAFRYQSKLLDTSDRADEEIPLGEIVIYIVPFAGDTGFNAILQSSHRTSRTVLSLLETQAQHAWGRRHNYQKRVIHDTLVPREEYMDLYLSLKEKHASTMISNWVESTDAMKHVFEDIGIAAFLILLWKETTNATGEKMTSFVDVGCGNGLLVYLLNLEGYTGFGFDLQSRKSWTVWKSLPGGADLRTISLDAPAMVDDSASLFPEGCFLIGNHADELTSWIPLLAHSIPNACGFINIPCCPFQLDGQRFCDNKHTFTKEDLSLLLGRSSASQSFQHTWNEFQRGPPTQGQAIGKSRNVTYLRYLSHLHLQTGWHLEKEALRIPSTKNWALIGRRRVWQTPLVAKGDHIDINFDHEVQNKVNQEVVDLVAKCSQRWKARLPPGQAAVSSSH